MIGALIIGTLTGTFMFFVGYAWRSVQALQHEAELEKQRDNAIAHGDKLAAQNGQILEQVAKLTPLRGPTGKEMEEKRSLTS